jgi:putative Holliday junction resolvase
MDYPAAEAQYVGFDYGTVRVGLAVADAGGIIASPLAVVPAEPAETLAVRVRAVLGGRTVKALVAGLPLDQHGAEGVAAQAARKQAELVAAGLGCPVVFIDERFTTAAMHASGKAQGVRHARRKQHIDAQAAQAILQAFLDGSPALS